MYCQYCKADKQVSKEGKVLVTLECNHSVIRPPNYTPLILKNDVSKSEIVEIYSEEKETAAPLPEEKFIFKSSDGRTLYPFQEEGIDFIKNSNFRCLIADEMGLGKTVQALGALKKYPEETLPVLILVKSALKLQWFSEAIRWLGVKGFLPQIITDGKTEPVEGFNVYISSYDVLRRFTTKSVEIKKNHWGDDIEKVVRNNPFYTFPFKTIILDEVQSIKNLRATRTAEVFRICKDKPNVIGLSGTPFKNSIMEYYPILHLLNPTMFPNEDRFMRDWVKYSWVNYSYKPVGLKDVEYFRQRTSDFIIRRERKEVMPQLPEINRVFHHVDFETEKLKKQYYSAEDDLIKQYEEKAKSKNPQELLGIMAVVRHIVGINKVQPTVEKITEFLLETDRKLVVFVHHQDVMELIHLLTTNWCLDGGYALPLKYHSGLGSDERNKVINDFRTGEARIMIASTLAAGEGLNLQFCSDCILVERQWNPANEEQAEGRFIRIGQERNQVNATYMIVSGTIDEWFTEIVEEKRRNFKATMSGDMSIDEGNLLDELMKVIIAKGRKRTVRGF